MYMKFTYSQVNLELTLSRQETCVLSHTIPKDAHLGRTMTHSGNMAKIPKSISIISKSYLLILLSVCDMPFQLVNLRGQFYNPPVDKNEVLTR